jgi:hypothetical protein
MTVVYNPYDRFHQIFIHENCDRNNTERLTNYGNPMTLRQSVHDYIASFPQVDSVRLDFSTMKIVIHIPFSGTGLNERVEIEALIISGLDEFIKQTQNRDDVFVDDFKFCFFKPTRVDESWISV